MQEESGCYENVPQLWEALVVALTTSHTGIGEDAIELSVKESAGPVQERLSKWPEASRSRGYLPR
jgi:hypothetical protein